MTADHAPSCNVPRARSRERARQAAQGVPVTTAGTPLPPPDGEVTGAQQRHLRDSFGAVLRGYRERAQLTQAQLADRAGVDRETVGRLERGRRRPRMVTIEVLAAALQLGTTANREVITCALADAAGPWLVDGPGGRVRARRKQMRRLADLQGRLKLQRQLERKVARLAEDAGPGEFGDHARNLLTALQADTAAMLRPPRKG